MKTVSDVAQAIARNIDRFGHYQGELSDFHYNDGDTITVGGKAVILPADNPCCIIANPAYNFCLNDVDLSESGIIREFTRALLDEADSRGLSASSLTDFNDNTDTEDVLDVLRSI